MKTLVRINLSLILIVFLCSDAPCQSISGVVNSYYAISAVNTIANTLTVDNASGLYNGEPVMIIQMKGATINSTNTASYGTISAIGDAGNYEFNTICSVSGTNVLLQNKLLNAYDPTGQVQLVAYAPYSSVTVSGTVTAKAWDPVAGKGGVVVIAATNSITLNANVDVSGQGFLGGALVNWPVPPYNCDWFIAVNGFFYDTATSGDNTAGMKGEGIAAYIAAQHYGMGKLASGGGGGNNANAGGAGGGNYGSGGGGGTRAGESTFDCHAQYPGVGGSSLATYGYSAGANRIFLGGGGGSGQENNGVGEPGANGGGIIILAAPTIMGGGGQLLSNGLQPSNPACLDPLQAEGDGGGGGGAGGTIIINSTTISGAITAQANGGRGSNSSNRVNDCTGPGGGGGGGTIWTAGATVPAAIGASVAGGVNGLVSSGNSKASCSGLPNGATGGNAGVAKAAYVAPVASASVCVVLATTALQTFTAVRAQSAIILTWALSSSAVSADIRSFVLQRASDSSGFRDLATIPASADSDQYDYSDPIAGLEGSLFYRLSWQDETGHWQYSRILTFTIVSGPDAGSLTLQPNPAKDQLQVTVYSWTAANARVTVTDVLGQPVLSVSFPLHKGANTLLIPVNKLAPAVYFLVLDSESGRQVREFLKR